MLERGMWQVSTKFGTPRIDGLSIDRLRSELPPDKSETKCYQPVVHSGPRIVELVNLERRICSLTKAAVANGQLSAEGTCPGIAAAVATKESDSWIKINGTYASRFIAVDIDVVITATEPSGATARMTITGTHRAEKIGECP